MRLTGHVSLLGRRGTRTEYTVGNPEGKRPLRRPRLRWDDNIKLDLREIGWGVMDWIDLAQDRDQWRALVNTLMNLWVAYSVGKFLSS
jgi:hypothetical protein